MADSFTWELCECEYFEMFHQNHFDDREAVFLKKKFSQENFCFHHHFQILLKTVKKPEP